MASSKLCAELERRAVPVPIASNAGALPLDALYEILLRLPGKELCRLRVVCRAWRSFLSDPLFAAAHAARHEEPLIVVGYAEDTSNGILFDIIDLLSGRVVRRVQGATGFERVVSTQLDLICVADGASGERFRVLNSGTGLVWTLPQGLAAEHAAHAHHRTSIAIGQVASTGEYKLLRTLYCSPNSNLQLYEVITLFGSGSGHIHWRGKTAPPYTVALGTWKSVVIDGLVYFLNDIGQEQEQGVTPFRIGSFDLETEEWRPTLRGPLRSVFNDAVGLPRSHIVGDWFSLAVLNGCLVVVHWTIPCLDSILWFLEDAEKCSWVMQQRIRIGMFRYPERARCSWPLLALNDGRIVFVHKARSKGLLKIYDPKTRTYTDVAEIGPCTAISLYTGNLLTLANGALFKM